MPRRYDTERRDYEVSSPNFLIHPEHVHVLSASSGVLAFYQKKMSKAVWRPAPGRKLGFLVTHGKDFFENDVLLGLIFLATPVIRLSARDSFLFPEAKGDKSFNYGNATKNYMDMSVCVATQPLGWYWNIGKLLALLAPTLGDYVEERYPKDKFKGITTTSLYGRGSQYNRIYKYLGLTKGFGHEHITDEEYSAGIDHLKSRCPNCVPECENPLPLIPKHVLEEGKMTEKLLPENEWCTVPYARFGDGVNARMRRISAIQKANGSSAKGKDNKGIFYHGHFRGVYYHPAVATEQRQAVIQQWYERWGLPRYERLRNEQAPYQDGKTGGSVYKES